LWIVAAFSPRHRGGSEIRLENRLSPRRGTSSAPTTWAGSLARVVVATPISLAIGLTAAAVSLLVGFTVGGLSGYLGGIADLLLSRLVEVVLCFPVLFLLLALAAFLPPSPAALVLAIGLTTWPGNARYARAEILKAKSLDYTRAARVAGASTARILLRHLLPNVLAPLLVSAAFGGTGRFWPRPLLLGKGRRQRPLGGILPPRPPTSRRPGGWRSSRAWRSS
jgi:peptide/nickel transport system permease protein